LEDRKIDGVPQKNLADRILSIERVDELRRLWPFPDIGALNLRKDNLPSRDLIE
jgi:hypothetical protein